MFPKKEEEEEEEEEEEKEEEEEDHELRHKYTAGGGKDQPGAAVGPAMMAERSSTRTSGVCGPWCGCCA